MKKIFLFLFACLPIIVLAQEEDCCCNIPASTCLDGFNKIETSVMRLDFLTKEMGFNKKKIKRGDAIQFEIVHFNPYLYKVELTADDSTVAVPINGKLASSFLDPSGLSGIVANLSKVVGVVPGAKSNTEELSHIDKSTGFEIQMEHVKAAFDVEKLRPRKQDSIDAIDKIQATTEKNIEDRKQKIEDVFNSVNTKFYELRRLFDAQHKLYPDCKDFNVSNNTLSHQQWDSLRRIIKEQIDASSSELRFYSLAIADYRYLLKGKQYMADSIITVFYTTAVTQLNAALVKTGYDKEDDMTVQLQLMTQTSSCYRSLPLFLNSDVKKLTLNIKPRYDSLGLYSYSTDFSLPFVQGRIFGVSAGIHLDGLKNNNYAVKTNIDPTVPDTTYSVVEDKSGGIGLGINALAYTGWNISKNGTKADYLGFAFGAGLSIESSVKPRVMLGVAFIGGDRNRFIISSGITVGYVTRLSDAYDVNTKYYVAPSDYTRDITATSFYLSLSYSFLGNQ